MALEIKVPTVGESISEVLIAEWLKPVGAAVKLDESVVALETDKVNVDIPAPAAGVITQILKQKGETAKVGEVIGYLQEGATAAATLPAPQPTQPVPQPTPVTAQAQVELAKVQGAIMPSAQRILAQAAIDPAQVAGTGPGGRVLKHDAQAAAALKLSEGQKIPLVYAAEPVVPSAPVVPVSAPVVAAPVVAAPPVPVVAPVPTAVPVPQPQPVAHGRREETVPMSPLRKRVAQRLVEAQQIAAILTTFNEVDMTAVMELRKRWQDDFTKKHGVKLGFMSIFVRAAVDALKAFPLVNAQIRGNDIILQHFYDIGVAVGGGKGLVVPILRDCDQMSFADIEKKMADLGARAKSNTLKLDELTGGTFSITNGGVYGSMMSTPILNPPQSAILGMHAIQERPVGVNGQIVLRPMMYLALSYDHRIIDGREAVQFLVRIKQNIEAPERMLFDL
jgi:2-oxoglutarate dehydrogenase E2 component (dihydrolipoamide succinyltransferase)